MEKEKENGNYYLGLRVSGLIVYSTLLLFSASGQWLARLTQPGDIHSELEAEMEMLKLKPHRLGFRV